MKVLIVGDSLSGLHVESDTSLDLARHCIERGHSVFWSEPFQLKFRQNRIFAEAKTLQLTKDAIVAAGESEHDLVEFKWILIRKDPPFNRDYLELCWLLAPYENQIQFLNKPTLLLRYHEKMIPLECARDGAIGLEEIQPMTLVRQEHEVKSIISASDSEEWILKPFLGHGGDSVHLIHRERLASLDAILQNEPWILQPLDPSIRTDGDYRCFFIRGELMGGFLRRPAEGSIVSNLAQGGSAVLRDLKPSEIELLSRLGGWLKKKDFFLAGADLIGGKISEVNVTSPTGFRMFYKLRQQSLSARCVEEMMKE